MHACVRAGERAGVRVRVGVWVWVWVGVGVGTCVCEPHLKVSSVHPARHPEIQKKTMLADTTKAVSRSSLVHVS